MPSHHALGVAAHGEHDDLWRDKGWKLAVLQPPLDLLHAIACGPTQGSARLRSRRACLGEPAPGIYSMLSCTTQGAYSLICNPKTATGKSMKAA